MEERLVFLLRVLSLYIYSSAARSLTCTRIEEKLETSQTCHRRFCDGPFPHTFCVLCPSIAQAYEWWSVATVSTTLLSSALGLLPLVSVSSRFFGQRRR